MDCAHEWWIVSYVETHGISRVLTREELSLATSLWPLQQERSGRLKELNKFQKDALDIANSNSFTLIQGPPGKPREFHACTHALIYYIS